MSKLELNNLVKAIWLSVPEISTQTPSVHLFMSVVFSCMPSFRSRKVHTLQPHSFNQQLKSIGEATNNKRIQD